MREGQLDVYGTAGMSLNKEVEFEEIEEMVAAEKRQEPVVPRGRRWKS